MMISDTVNRAKYIWKSWDIQVLIVASLTIQYLLTFLAPYRKRSPKRRLKFSLWLLYLSADAVALYAIGLISTAVAASRPEYRGCAGYTTEDHVDLLVFWAPFLVLHLGGPDTITALALEDNELWHRHALQLATQVIVTVYVIGLTITRNKLLLPTLLIFVDGFIKYMERTFALYYASADTFRDSLRQDPGVGPSYARLMEEFTSAMNANIPTEIHDHKKGPSIKDIYNNIKGSGISSTESSPAFGAAGYLYSNSRNVRAVEMKETNKRVQRAYVFFNMFKALLADSIMSYKERDQSRAFFLSRKIQANEAFAIIEIELNFIYDVFYTKAFLLLKKASYARLVCFSSVVASLLVFSFRDKTKYNGTNVKITYALLWGAITLDLITALIYVFSDWWIILSSSRQHKLQEYGGYWPWSPRIWASCCFPLPRLATWFRDLCHRLWPPQNPPPRWSQTISSYNLLNRCLNDEPCFFNCLSLIDSVKELYIEWKYVSRDAVDPQLLGFIMEELQKKARVATNTDQIQQVCAARGNLVLQDEYFLVSQFLRPWTVDIDYDESLLTWHLATDICYWTTTTSTTDGANNGPDVGDVNKYREISKQLSDYMLYLLLRQQRLVSSVAGMSDIRFEETLEEARKHGYSPEDIGQADEKQRQFCDRVLQVNTDIPPSIAKGDRSKSVLFDACRLAKQLKLLGNNQWEVTSKVWLELLCYAAIRCSPRSHIAQLRRGGELITLVWLLMAHLGLREHFRQNELYGWNKQLMIH